MAKVLAKAATAGFEEKMDILVTVEPGTAGIEVELKSSVKRQYGDHMIALIKNVVKEEGFENVKVTAVDKGAWDYTIIARVKGALQRGVQA